MQLFVSQAAPVGLLAVTGVVLSGLQGHVDWPIAVPFAVGAVGAMRVGRAFAGRLSGPRLQQGFAVIAGLFAVGLVIRVVLGHA